MDSLPEEKVIHVVLVAAVVIAVFLPILGALIVGSFLDTVL